MSSVKAYDLTEVERTFGFTYPKSFHSSVEEFVTFCGSPAFQRHFPTARLLISVTEIVAERESMDCRQSLGVSGDPLPAEIVERAGKSSRILVPFLRDEGTQWRDTYSRDTFAFNLESPGPEFAVIVWSYSDPMIVHEWEGFTAFFQWLRGIVRSYEEREPRPER